MRKSTCTSCTFTGIFATHCVPSECNNTSNCLQSALASSRGSMTPVSLLHHIKDTTAISDARSLNIDSSSCIDTMPSLSLLIRIISMPRSDNATAISETAACSSWLVTTSFRSGRAWHAECNARFADSVPHEVNVISDGEACISLAICSLAKSTICRAS